MYNWELNPSSIVYQCFTANRNSYSLSSLTTCVYYNIIKLSNTAAPYFQAEILEQYFQKEIQHPPININTFKRLLEMLNMYHCTSTSNSTAYFHSTIYIGTYTRARPSTHLMQLRRTLNYYKREHWDGESNNNTKL